MKTIASDLGLRLGTTIVAVVILVSGLTLWGSTAVARKDLTRRADEVSAEFTRITAYHLWHVDQQGIDHAARVMLQSPLVVGVRVYDGTGKELVDLSRSGDVFLTRRRQARYHDLATNQHHVVGTVDLLVGDGELRVRERTVALSTASLSLAVLLAVLIASRILLNRYLAKPLNRLQQGIRRIAEGDYHQPMAPGRRAEIDSIVQDVQAMGARIASREAELRRSHRKLLRAQRLETVGRLAGGIAHDFNNILLVILNMADMVEATSNLKPDSRKRMESLRQAAERAADLIRQLLTFSRQEAVELQSVDLKESLARLEEMLGRTLPEAIDLSMEVDPDLWPVWADPTQIEQVVMNLAINARDAMHPTGGQLLFKASNHHRPAGPDQVELLVRDTGAGIAPTVIDKIFDPFFTTKEVGQGTGLGLATVHGILETIGGSIEVESRPGAGTTFRIRIPRASERSGSGATTRHGPQAILG